MKSSSLAALKVVILTTFGAASDEDFIKMTTFSFQCCARALKFQQKLYMNIAATPNDNQNIFIHLTLDYSKFRITGSLWGESIHSLPAATDPDPPSQHTHTHKGSVIKKMFPCDDEIEKVWRTPWNRETPEECFPRDDVIIWTFFALLWGIHRSLTHS